mgnify:FL=1
MAQQNETDIPNHSQMYGIICHNCGCSSHCGIQCHNPNCTCSSCDCEKCRK